jgi:hypothetical protein
MSRTAGDEDVPTADALPLQPKPANTLRVLHSRPLGSPWINLFHNVHRYSINQSLDEDVTMATLPRSFR